VPIGKTVRAELDLPRVGDPAYVPNGR
jgi:hypothetical protein